MFLKDFYWCGLRLLMPELDPETHISQFGYRQTARIEECANPGYPCPLVAECYDTKCLQKYAYHRFLIYDPHDYYFPFSVDSFKLPSACACYNGPYKFEH